jgi:two-component system, LuxR family, sensor kinase FixL
VAIWSDRLDGDRRISSASTLSTRLGWSDEGGSRIENRSWIRTLCREDRGRARRYLETAGDESGEIDLRLDGNGPLEWIRLTLTGHDEQGGLLCVARDASREHQLACAMEAWGASPVAHSSAWTMGRSVEELANLTGADLILISERLPDPHGDRARVLAMAAPNTAVEILEHNIAGQPWEDAFEGNTVLTSHALRTRWPDVSVFDHFGAEAFICLPLDAPTGNPTGVVMGVFRRTPDDPDWLEDLFRICANRIALEVQRTHAAGRHVMPVESRDDHSDLISRSAERYRAYVEGASTAIWCLELDEPILTNRPMPDLTERILTHGRLIECNDAFAHELGRPTARDLSGAPIRDLKAFSEGAPSVALRNLVESDFKLSHTEVADDRPGAKARHLAFNLLPIIEDGAFLRLWATQSDVTHNVEEREALRASHRHLATIFDSALDGIVVLDQELTVVDVNGAFLGIARSEQRKVLGIHISAFDAGSNSAPIETLVRAAESQGPYRIRVSLQRMDGTPFPAEVSFCHRKEDGGRTYGFIRDRSIQVDAEERDRVHRNQLTHISRLNTIGEMASGIAHELNQPLAAIVNYTRGGIRQLRASELECPDLMRALMAAADQAERAGGVIRRIRSFIRKGENQVEVTRLNDIVRDSLALAEFGLSQTNIQLEVDYDTEDWLVLADPIQVEQVILNLLRNALDALRETPEGDRVMRIRTLSQSEHAAQVQVCDNGPGIDPQEVEDAFAPFVSTKAEGIGLGLPISRSIIEAHGGRLWCEPLEDGMTCFRFTLPLRSEDY